LYYFFFKNVKNDYFEDLIYLPAMPRIKYWLDGIFDDVEFVADEETVEIIEEIIEENCSLPLTNIELWLMERDNIPKKETLMSSDIDKGEFIPSSDYKGNKDGYVFKLGKYELGYYRLNEIKTVEVGYNRVNEIKTVEVRQSEMVLCSNFIYCSNRNCPNRHWYKSGYECRIARSGQLSGNFSDFFKKEEKEALNRAVERFKREGVNVIIK
jgi:hypothetical protein